VVYNLKSFAHVYLCLIHSSAAVVAHAIFVYITYAYSGHPCVMGGGIIIPIAILPSYAHPHTEGRVNGEQKANHPGSHIVCGNS
jgi:hypothetical protein